MRVLISVVLLISTVFAKAAVPDGFWQIGSNEESAAWQEGYVFDGDKFSYRNSEYNSLNPISQVSGHYTIKNDSIYFTAEYFDAYDFDVVEWATPPDCPTWTLSSMNGLREYMRFKRPETYSESFHLGDKELTIGGIKYCFIRNNYNCKVLEVNPEWPVFNGIPKRYRTNETTTSAKTDSVTTAPGVLDGFWTGWYGINYLFSGDRFKVSTVKENAFNPIKGFGGHFKVWYDLIIFRVEYLQIADMEDIHLNSGQSQADQWEVSKKSKDTINFRFKKPIWATANLVKTGDSFKLDSAEWKLSDNVDEETIPENYNEWPVFDSFLRLIGYPFSTE